MPEEPLSADDPAEIAGYRLQARLGAGGMGRVYLALTPGGRRIAVKVIRPELGDDPDFRRRFRQETQAARQVHGIYAAQVLDADPDADPPWLATAYVPGPSLQQAVADHGPMPAASVLTLTAGIAEALQAIHAAGIVHRDLKPSNVLLAPDGPHVIDFGIARAAEATTLTRTGMRVGSPQFMAPEQIQDLPVTPAIDVFALGSLAVFAATGKAPFGEGSEAAVMYRVLHEPPGLAGCPEPLRGLAERCLAKDPSARPSPAQIVAACEEADAGQAAAGPGLAARATPGAGPAGAAPLGAGLAAAGLAGAGLAGAGLAGAAAGAAGLVPPAGATMAGPPTVSQTRQAPDPGHWRLPWTSRPALITGTAIAAALLVLAVVALRALGSPAADQRASTGPGSATAGQQPAAHASPAASLAPSPATSPQPTPRSCLIGTWIATSDQLVNFISTEPVQFTAAGVIQTFAADGRATENWGKGTVYKGSFQGVPWTEIIHGVITMHYEVRGGSLLLSDAVTHHGGWSLYDAGVLNNSGPLSLEPGPERFTCSGRSLKQFVRNGSSELTRRRSG